jgi:hypothetical protein
MIAALLVSLHLSERSVVGGGGEDVRTDVAAPRPLQRPFSFYTFGVKDT